MTVLPPSWSESDIQPEAWPGWRASYREKLGITSNRPVIGMISSFLIESKGVHHFIDMALSLKDAYPDAVFLIVGACWTWTMRGCAAIELLGRSSAPIHIRRYPG